MTGMSPIAKATLRSLAIRAVVADTKELRIVSYDAALPVLFVQEQTRTGDLNPQWDMIFLSLMSWLFIFLFYASRHAVNDPGLRFAQVWGIHKARGRIVKCIFHVERWCVSFK